MSSNSTVIAGFLLVRIPSENFDEEIIMYPDTTPTRGELVYGGVTRLPWSDLSGAVFQDDASTRLKNFHAALNRENADFTGIPTWANLDSIYAIDEELGESQRREIIAVQSEKLAEVKGQFPTDVELVWLGLDTFELGGWSMIFEGIFLTPAFDSSDWFRYLNRHGLFEDREIAMAFGRRFTTWSTEEAREPINPSNLDIVDVYRVIG